MYINESSKQKQTQLRLILPVDWMRELDVIARARFISRLALIRHYLRACLNEDIEHFRQELAATKQNQYTLQELEAFQEQILPRDYKMRRSTE